MRVATSAGVRAVMRRELRRLRDRRLLLLALVLPLAGWLTLGAVFSQRLPRHLPVTIVDQDGSALSRRVVRALAAVPSLRVVAAQTDATVAESMLRRGDTYAVIILPRGLERGVARTDAPPVMLLYNAQWVLPANIILRDVRAVTTALSLGIEAEQRAAQGAPAALVAAAAEPVRAELHPLYNPYLDYAAFLFLALVPALFHMFVLLTAVDVMGRELKHATARAWLRTAGTSTPRALAGKLLPHLAWFALFGSVQLELSLRWIGAPVAGSRLLLHAGLILMTLAYLCIGALLVALTANLRVALTAAALLAAPSFAVVGVSFPLGAMPVAARAWAGLLPVTHYIGLQTAVVARGAPASASLPAIAGLAAFAAGGMLIALLRFPALLREPRYWRRA